MKFKKLMIVAVAMSFATPALAAKLGEAKSLRDMNLSGADCVNHRTDNKAQVASNQKQAPTNGDASNNAAAL